MRAGPSFDSSAACIRRARFIKSVQQKLHDLTRRGFLRAGLLGSTLAFGGTAMAAVVKPERETDDGLKLGMASYTYRNFKLDQAIEMTKDAGLHYIEFKRCSSAAEKHQRRMPGGAGKD